MKLALSLGLLCGTAILTACVSTQAPRPSFEADVGFLTLSDLTLVSGHWKDPACQASNPIPMLACVVIGSINNSEVHSGDELVASDEAIAVEASPEAAQLWDEAERAVERYAEKLEAKGWSRMRQEDGTKPHAPTLRKVVNGHAECVIIFGRVTDFEVSSKLLHGVVEFFSETGSNDCERGVLRIPVII